MTTLRDIVQRGFRESGIIGVGTMPDGEEFDEAFAHLQTIIRSLFGNELGEGLIPYSIGVNGTISANDDTSSLTYIPDNARLIFNLDGPVTLHLNPEPRDGARLAVVDNLGNFSTNNVVIYGNGRRIDGATSITLTIDEDVKEWFYRDDLGDWVRVTDLAPSNDSPFPDEFDDLLITLLAVRINPRYGATTGQETVELLKRSRAQLKARYRQETEAASELGIVLLPSRRYTIKHDFTLGG